MSTKLINHSRDLTRLKNEGYELKIFHGYLIISHIPYVNENRNILFGALVTELDLASNVTNAPSSHTIYFMGGHPCDHEGLILNCLKHQTKEIELCEGLVVNHSFSCKKNGRNYSDYYEKITSYVRVISNPAISIDKRVTAKTFNVEETEVEDSVFRYIDSNSSRAKISIITDKLRKLKIGIFGLGGTGSYVLDQVAETSVSEIHIFDSDIFSQRNAFRAPGAVSLQELRKNKKSRSFFEYLFEDAEKHSFTS